MDAIGGFGSLVLLMGLSAMNTSAKMSSSSQTPISSFLMTTSTTSFEFLLCAFFPPVPYLAKSSIVRSTIGLK
uniref:Putative secreted protein n=1 Tax=Anopheles darlingi TaxID=43151 RepID=A0A2M4DNF5_ANODA